MIVQNEAMHASHKIHGTAGSLGFRQTSKAAGKIEELLRRFDPDDTLGSIIWSEIERALDAGAGELQISEQPGQKRVTQGPATHRVLIVGNESAYMPVINASIGAPYEIDLVDNLAAAHQKIKRSRYECGIFDCSSGTMSKLLDLALSMRLTAGTGTLPLGLIGTGEPIDQAELLFGGFSTVLPGLPEKDD
jgi:HPt (histidine-containing phosphotransfer) domain-containing protein